LSLLENASTLEQVVVEKEKPKGAFDGFRILILALGHLVNDSYSNIVPPLLPMLKAAYGLSYAASGRALHRLHDNVEHRAAPYSGITRTSTAGGGSWR